jgi:exonuclease III
MRFGLSGNLVKASPDHTLDSRTGGSPVIIGSPQPKKASSGVAILSKVKPNAHCSLNKELDNTLIFEGRNIRVILTIHFISNEFCILPLGRIAKDQIINLMFMDDFVNYINELKQNNP